MQSSFELAEPRKSIHGLRMFTKLEFHLKSKNM